MNALRCCCLAVLLPVSAVASDNPPARAEPSPVEVRQAFRRLLDRPAVALNVRVHSTRAEKGFVTEHLSFASEKTAAGEERVPVLIVRPEEARADWPAVIVLHGPGGNE